MMGDFLTAALVGRLSVRQFGTCFTRTEFPV